MIFANNLDPDQARQNVLSDDYYRVPTSSGNHGKPGKSQKKYMQKLHGIIMEFEKKTELSWENHGIL